MSWLRWWQGTVNDPKWRIVAARAKCRAGDCVAVWAYLLEVAKDGDGDVSAADTEECAVVLGYEVETVSAIIAAMRDRSLIDGQRITSWEKRQPKREDDSRLRVAAYRERKASEKSVTEQRAEVRNADVTHCNAPETESETDTSSLRSDVERASAPPQSRQKSAAKPTPRQALETVLRPDVAAAVLDHRQKIRKPLTEYAAELLAKAFDATGDPNGAARTMIERGWTGFRPEWLENDRRQNGKSGQNQRNRSATGDAFRAINGGPLFPDDSDGDWLASPGRDDDFAGPTLDLAAIGGRA